MSRTNDRDAEWGKKEGVNQLQHLQARESFHRGASCRNGSSQRCTSGGIVHRRCGQSRSDLLLVRATFRGKPLNLIELFKQCKRLQIMKQHSNLHMLITSFFSARAAVFQIPELLGVFRTSNCCSDQIIASDAVNKH